MTPDLGALVTVLSAINQNIGTVGMEIAMELQKLRETLADVRDRMPTNTTDGGDEDEGNEIEMQGHPMWRQALQDLWG